jgi:ABC-type Co2+ transport system permease subunit
MVTSNRNSGRGGILEMDLPAMYYVNVSFTWVLMAVSIGGYFIVSKKQGEKWAFWPIVAAAWAVFATSHTLLVAGTSTDEWYLTLLRVLGYVLMLVALSVLMVRRKGK